MNTGKTLPMTDEEILASFNNALQPRKHVEILAELNDTTQDRISDILVKMGVDRRRLPRKKAPKPKEELSLLLESNASGTVPVADIVESVCVSISDMTARLKEAQRQIKAEIEALRAQIEEKEKELERVERLIPSLVRCENEVRPI